MLCWTGAQACTAAGARRRAVWGRRLVALKNIFSRQLPNMPREYIARLVLDRRHRSVAIVRQGRACVGGITYRAFPDQARPALPRHALPPAVPPGRIPLHRRTSARLLPQ